MSNYVKKFEDGIYSRRIYLFLKKSFSLKGYGLAEVLSVSVFSKNCDSNFFWSVDKEWQ
jgi:hypothetical protein